MIPMQISEVADRYTICMLKSERTDENMQDELKYYGKELDEYPIVSNFIRQLYIINGKIWDLEADLRKGKEGELGLEEVGRRAIEIRNLNKLRIGLKNQITEAIGSGFKENKVDHASE